MAGSDDDCQEREEARLEEERGNKEERWTLVSIRELGGRRMKEEEEEEVVSRSKERRGGGGRRRNVNARKSELEVELESGDKARS